MFREQHSIDGRAGWVKNGEWKNWQHLVWTVLIQKISILSFLISSRKYLYNTTSHLLHNNWFPVSVFFYRALTVYKRLPCHFIIIFRAICTFIFFIVVCFFLYCYSFLWLNLFEIIKLLQRHGIYLFYIEKLRNCHYLWGFFNSKFKHKCILKVLFIIILI